MIKDTGRCLKLKKQQHGQDGFLHKKPRCHATIQL
jgi:hypothetical protein